MANENECNHQCEGCSQAGTCSEAKIVKSKLVEGASVKHCIGIVSGKGGVGKSFVSSYLAVLMARKGYRVGVLDADITGPSIPFSFGLDYKALGNGKCIFPGVTSKYGIQIMSSNMLLDNATDPIIWRGPMIGQMVDQFYSEVLWEDLDYLFIDMPPGTGDVPLTIFQSIKMDGIVIATSPQGLVSLIVEKAMNMAHMMDIPCLGIVSNMSYVKCPDCGKRIDIYGKDKVQDLAARFNVENYDQVPFDAEVARFVDEGRIEDLNAPYLTNIASALEKLSEEK